MPGPTGLLTPEDKQKVINWLQSKGQDPACPFCGVRQWVIADHLVQPVTVGGGGSLQLGGAGYPQVMLISPPCGYTVLINAVIAGVLPGNRAKEGG